MLFATGKLHDTTRSREAISKSGGVTIYKILKVDLSPVCSQRSNWVPGAQCGKSKYKALSAYLIQLMQGIFLLNTAEKSRA